jgi:hypothetical protein
MLRLLLFMHHVAFVPHALHHVVLGSFLLIYARWCEAGTRDLRGAS